MFLNKMNHFNINGLSLLLFLVILSTLKTKEMLHKIKGYEAI